MTATPATLKMRYPDFEAVADDRVQYWLDDALRIVTTAWGADADVGQMALAAHNMIRNRVPGLAGGKFEALAGVTKLKSGSMDVAFSDAAVSAQVAGGYSSTPYGQEFAALLRRYSGGPRLVGYVEPSGICWS